MSSTIFFSVSTTITPIFSAPKQGLNSNTWSWSSNNTQPSLTISSSTFIPRSSSSSSSTSTSIAEEETAAESNSNQTLSSTLRGCKACGKEEIEQGCNGEGRIQGGIATVPGFGWWPIKAYRPCPGFVASGGRYKRQGQSMDEVAGFGRVEKVVPVETAKVVVPVETAKDVAPSSKKKKSSSKLK